MDDRTIGFFCGLCISLGILPILFKLTKKEGIFKCRYDERQQLVRGRGYKYGFFGCIASNLLFICLDQGFGRAFMDTPLMLFLAIMAGCMIQASYCIWNEGYFSLNEYPNRIVGMFIALLLFNFVCAVSMLHCSDGLLEDGILTFFPWANLFCMGVCIFILGVIFVKKCVDHTKAE